jgi:hypothetical protein
MRLIDRLNPLKRKSAPQRLVESVEDAISKPMGRKVKLPDPPSGKAARVGLLAVGGAMGLTAGSAGISSLRRRAEASKDGS